jgi:ABC-type Na+ efflux pump permease subunit
MIWAVWLVLLNEFRLLVRDGIGIFMLILAPVVIILVAGFSLSNIYGAGPGPNAYAVPVFDEDGGALGTAVKSALDREPAITMLAVDSLASAQAVVRQRDRAPLAIIIPAGTTRTLESGGEAQLVLYVDPVKRLEVNAIELRLDQLSRQITVRAQDEARRKLRQQSDAIQSELDQIARRINQVRAAAAHYRSQIMAERQTAAVALNAQVRTAVGELEQQTQIAIEHTTTEMRAALEREMAPRRNALVAVSQYLTALEASEHEFDQWFRSLRKIAGSHAAEIPPPPTLPVAPTTEQLSELSKPVFLPAIVPPQIPALPRLNLELPNFPKPPDIDLPTATGLSLSLVASDFPGYLSWSERTIDGRSVQPNAFNQYVPGFGITFLLIAMLMAIGMGLIDERDWGTLQRLRISGAPLVSVLAGKLCLRSLAGLLQMAVLFAVGRILFGISLGSVPAMLLVPTAAISFAAAGFSLLIACIARTRDSVMPMGAVAAMAMSAIGGCWWPLDFEPGWIRELARWMPTTWTMQAYNDLMIRQAPAVNALWPSAYAAALGCIYLTIGIIAAGRLDD